MEPSSNFWYKLYIRWWMKCPSAKMRCHKNSFKELAKCSGTPPLLPGNMSSFMAVACHMKGQEFIIKYASHCLVLYSSEDFVYNGNTNYVWSRMGTKILIYQNLLCISIIFVYPSKLIYFIQFKCNLEKFCNWHSFAPSVKSTLQISCFDWKW